MPFKGWHAWERQEERPTPRTDWIVAEEPLEIRVAFPDEDFPVAVTMRTPGEDEDLALGFLYTEGLIDDPACFPRIRTERPAPNVLRVVVPSEVPFDRQRMTRHFYMTSSCGICGKAAIEAVFAQGFPSLPEDGPVIPAALLYELPRRLEEAQALFRHTGGLHAAAVFDLEGRLLWLREDVGRHNAVDKVVGAALREGRLPLHRALLLVSGRAGFEIVQKALRAGIPLLAAIGAPSSLALELAQAAGMTVGGFLRGQRCNLYTAPWRIQGGPASQESPLSRISPR